MFHLGLMFAFTVSRKVILLSHEECEAYSGEELADQKRDAELLRGILYLQLRERFPCLEVRLYYITWDGHICPWG